MQKLRQWIQSYVGVSDVTKMVNIVEARAKTRHSEVMKVLEGVLAARECDLNFMQDQARLSHERYLALAEMVRQFEQRMIMKHIDQPREFTPPVLDWDTVQAIALHDLEKGQ